MTIITIIIAALFLLLLIHRMIMATEAQLQASLDNIQVGIAGLGVLLAAQTQTIADLKTQLAAGTPVSQAQLDALETQAQAIESTLAGFGATPPPVV